MRQLKRSLARGVTLIELMIGLVVLTILAGLASPFFVDYIANARLREAGHAVLGAALYAQSEAVKRNAAVRLSTSGSSVRVTIGTGPDLVVLRDHTLAEGLSAATADVDFGSDGMTRPLGTEAAIDITASAVTCSSAYRCPRLRIEAGGAFRLCGDKLVCS